MTRLVRAFATGLATALGIAVAGNLIDYWQDRHTVTTQLRSVQ